MNESLIKSYSQYLVKSVNLSRAILVVGASGTGKTTCADNLPDAETCIINIENKPLPFKKVFTNVLSNLPQDHNKILQLICDTSKDFKYLFIDSFTAYWEVLYRHCQLTQKGFEIYNVFNNEITKFLTTIKSLQTPFVILTARDELVKIENTDGSTASKLRAGIIGKQWETRQIESQFTYVLFTDPKKQAGKEALSYDFITNSDTIRTAKTPSKYGFSFRVPNDIKSICDSIERVDGAVK